MIAIQMRVNDCRSGNPTGRCEGLCFLYKKEEVSVECSALFQDYENLNRLSVDGKAFVYKSSTQWWQGNVAMDEFVMEVSVAVKMLEWIRQEGGDIIDGPDDLYEAWEADAPLLPLLEKDQEVVP